MKGCVVRADPSQGLRDLGLRDASGERWGSRVLRTGLNLEKMFL